MIAGVIRWSLANRVLVLLVTLVVTAWDSGPWCARRSTPFRICPMCR